MSTATPPTVQPFRTPKGTKPFAVQACEQQPYQSPSAVPFSEEEAALRAALAAKFAGNNGNGGTKKKR